MLKISHRVNSVAQLESVDCSNGIEVDIRASHDDIYLAHDPFIRGELLSDLLEKYAHKLIILNVKEDGLEDRAIELLGKYNVSEYFFLDQPFPTLQKNSRMGRNCAVRVSENEPLPYRLDSMSWIWIDSFTGNWNHLVETLDFARKTSLKTCLVSPELQGRENMAEINEIKELIQKAGLMADAVCTKFPEEW
jgi:hypothetical protein